MTVARDEVSLLHVVTVILRHRWSVGRLALGTAFLVGAVTFSLPRTYSSEARFIPQSTGPSSAVSSIAARFGVNVAGGNATESAEFYADLLKSREILASVVDARYSYHEGDSTVTGTLVEILKTSGRSPALRREAAIKSVDRSTSATVDAKTGIVTLRFQAPQAEVAQQVAARFLDELNQFNLEKRQSRAAAERRFTEGRLEQAHGELQAAEDDLQTFLERNRVVSGSPLLVLERDRLQRAVDMRQQVFTSLAQSYEQARIEEVRNTPALTVVAHAEVPLRPDGRGTIRNTILALLVAGFLGLAAALARDYGEHLSSTAPTEIEAYRRVRADLGADVRRMVARIWRRRR